jgi:hypothetical protein
MTAINHSLTGALIGLTVADPVAAVPIAFLSHFVLDSVPHFGFGNQAVSDKGVQRIFINYLIVDTILCFALVAVLLLSRPVHWPLAIICAFLAASPDLFSFNRFYKFLRGLPWKPNIYSKFAGGIQWFERPIGIVVEAVWLASMLFCISIFLRH